MRDPDEHKPTPSKKDKKRWCGGHKGREHKAVCKSFKEIKKWGDEANRILICEVCGKELAIYWAPNKWFTPKKHSKPDWVTC